jgi:hypothetical protein
LKILQIVRGRGGREGGWRIVIPMPEAINFVDGRRQKELIARLAAISFEKSFR